MIKSIVFDFDGVIGNTYHINMEVCRLFDTEFTEQDFKDHHNGNVFEEPKINLTEDVIPLFDKEQKPRFLKEHLFPLQSVFETLNNNYKLFIISSSVDENINHFLELGGFEKYFSEVYGSRTHRSKIVKFEMLFKKYDFTASECLFVTDTIGDIREAKKINVQTIAVTWGYHHKELLQTENPKAIAHTSEELLKIIEKISD